MNTDDELSFNMLACAKKLTELRMPKSICKADFRRLIIGLFCPHTQSQFPPPHAPSHQAHHTLMSEADMLVWITLVEQCSPARHDAIMVWGCHKLFRAHWNSLRTSLCGSWASFVTRICDIVTFFKGQKQGKAHHVSFNDRNESELRLLKFSLIHLPNTTSST